VCESQGTFSTIICPNSALISINYYSEGERIRTLWNLSVFSVVAIQSVMVPFTSSNSAMISSAINEDPTSV